MLKTRLGKYIVWLLIASLAFTIVVMFALVNPFREKIEIAVVLPFSDISSIVKEKSQSNLDAINLYLKSVNKAGGVNGKQVVLSVYDDQGKQEVALQVAEKIVRSKAIAVLGHATSGLTLAASKAYQEYNMPVISGAATADQLGDFGWFFRTVFSNQDQGILIANYVKKVLNFPKINLVYSDDAYGRNLASTIEGTFLNLGGNILNKWFLEKNPEATIQQIIKTLKSSIEAGNDPGILVAVTSFDNAADFIRGIKLANLNIPIFGGDSLSNLDIIQHFTDDPKEKEDKGFFTTGIQAVTPVIFDILDEAGQNFKSEFEQAYSKDPSWAATCFHDGAVAVVEALKQGKINVNNTSELRSLLIKELKKFNTPTTGFQGAGRLIYFDNRGNAQSPAYVSLYDRQQLISGASQSCKNTISKSE